ncbi:GNAT family N-acetyltransferase [Chitiniphilus purpureus]|uniref:GNAT family N-acetyltransferase n=1 Tax=Chitiniphilus purpureus TaxID=2981137 RepID=A0ABY6DID3_9NEIS|nr:GNAT family N-acetyltransferase [Chitiniphilus sp. CD1]UXY13787.1 GNAT family N-acetyltransferase [Chitiniphilus sp. CD1]
MQLRVLTESDLDAVLAIQRECYPAAWQESRATFARKLALSPQSNWLAHEGDVALGYLFTHPWHDRTPPALDTGLPALPQGADRHFLHDLAIHPQARGRGIAARLVEHALAWGAAQGLREARLVAVLGAERFWQGLGFAPLRTIGAQPAAYGKAARIMGRPLVPV